MPFSPNHSRAGPRRVMLEPVEVAPTTPRTTIDGLASLLRGRRVVVLTGAGLSTESGIPDYRGPDAPRPPRRPIHGPEFVRSEAVRRRYWARSMVGWPRFREAEPNAGHRAVAELEERGVVAGVITQNVDRLHHRAGSRRVLELHGALAEVVCLGCGALEPRDAVQVRLLALNPGWASRPAALTPDGDAEIGDGELAAFRPPVCARCGAALKPRVVFFGENVARPLVDEAFGLLDSADALLVVGTSLAVFSGYRFLLRAADRGTPVAIVNLGPVRGEARAALKLEGRAGDALPKLAAALARA